MADLGSVEADINGFPRDIRVPLRRIFTSLLRDMRFGHPKGQQPDPLENFGGGFFHGVTPANIAEEFSVPHNFGRPPYLALQCLRLDYPNSSIVPLQVTRPADDKRIYLSSSFANAPICLIIEG